MAAVVVAALSAALLERAGRMTPFGVPAIGFLVLVGATLAGAEIVSTIACVAVWAAVSAAAALRPA
jgi:hypothetical protein